MAHEAKFYTMNMFNASYFVSAMYIVCDNKPFQIELNWIEPKERIKIGVDTYL